MDIDGVAALTRIIQTSKQWICFKEKTGLRIFYRNRARRSRKFLLKVLALVLLQIYEKDEMLAVSVGMGCWLLAVSVEKNLKYSFWLISGYQDQIKMIFVVQEVMKLILNSETRDQLKQCFDVFLMCSCNNILFTTRT